MPFQKIETLNNSDAFKFLVFGYDAVDTEHCLALCTTRGHCRNARRWFVIRYHASSGRANYEDGPVMFRAFDLDEALAKIGTPRIEGRIRATFDIA